MFEKRSDREKIESLYFNYKIVVILYCIENEMVLEDRIHDPMNCKKRNVQKEKEKIKKVLKVVQ